MGTQEEEEEEEQSVSGVCVALIEHVVVFLAVVRRHKVLHLLLGPARPLPGPSAHRTQAVVVFVVRGRLLRLLRKTRRHFVIVNVEVINAHFSSERFGSARVDSCSCRNRMYYYLLKVLKLQIKSSPLNQVLH